MRSETREILEKLQRLEWFSAIGCRIDGDVTRVSSWDEAVLHLGGHKWEKIKLAWRNKLTAWLCIHQRARYQEWNELVTKLYPQFIPMVEANVNRAVENENLRKPVCDAANWDVLNLLMEAEYSDLRKPNYYAALGLVYLDGHFPCGWDSKHSGGRIIVY